MKKLALLVALTTVAQSLCLAGADPKTDVKSAVKKLAEKSNYSWNSTFIGTPEMRMSPLEGRAEKGGFTYCKFTFADNQIEMAFNGDKSAIKREGEWQSAEELESSNSGIARRLKTFKAPVAEAEELAELGDALVIGREKRQKTRRRRRRRKRERDADMERCV